MRAIRLPIWTIGGKVSSRDKGEPYLGGHMCVLVGTNIRNGRLHLCLMASLGWQLGFLKGTEWFPVVILEYTLMGYLVAHRKMFQLRIQFGSLMASSLEIKNLWLYSVEYALVLGGGGLAGYQDLLMRLRDCAILNECVRIHGVGWKRAWQRKFLQQPDRENDLKSHLIWLINVEIKFVIRSME